MKRVNITIDEREHLQAQSKAKKVDLNLSQLIRKLLREYSPLCNPKK